jgi:hypothetical protein
MGCDREFYKRGSNIITTIIVNEHNAIRWDTIDVGGIARYAREISLVECVSVIFPMPRGWVLSRCKTVVKHPDSGKSLGRIESGFAPRQSVRQVGLHQYEWAVGHQSSTSLWADA